MVLKKEQNETGENDRLEKEMTGLAGIVGLLLLVFALGYLAFTFQTVQPGYSALYWDQTPALSVQNETPIIFFSVELESHEHSISRYRMKAYLNDKIAATKIVDLNANKKQEITFTTTSANIPSEAVEVKVTAQRIADSNSEKDGPILEIVDWVNLSTN